jgi:hypothetical protein
MHNSDTWTWAAIDQNQISWLQEAEQTLGAEVDILLAYVPGNQQDVREEMFSKNGLQTARLSESQVECLQGLEEKMQVVVIAYEKQG